MRHCFLILFYFWTTGIFAQQSYPLNGPTNLKSGRYALTHATVWTDADHVIQDALLLIENGKLVYVGAFKDVSSNYTIIDQKGKVIYPAFIDLFSDYGIKWEPKNALRNTHGFYSAKRGAFHWNEAIRAEEKAAQYFSPDEKQKSAYLAAGFGVAMSALQDGICRGSSVLVNTVASVPHEAILREEASMNWSFHKGSSTVDYPTSAMGSVALIRQTLYDIKRNYTAQENNISFMCLMKNQQLPVLFEAENKWAVLRAAKIAKEFSANNWIIKGNGDEYQRSKLLAEMGLPMVIPVNFPKPYDVEDPFDANLVSLADLKHWEYAPANLAVVHAAKIPFAITMRGCEDPQTFLKNLRMAVQQGLPKSEALRALTETPARLIGASTICGSIGMGMPANFIICDKPIFDKDAKVLAHWSGAEMIPLSFETTIPVSGLFALQSELPYHHLQLTQQSEKWSGNLIGTDTIPLTVTREAGTYQLTWAPDKKTVLHCTMRLAFINQNNQIQASGIATWTEGKTVSVMLKQETAILPKDLQLQDSTTIIVPEIPFPFVEFGRINLPEQEEVIFKGASIWTNTEKSILYDQDVQIKGGKIVAIGSGLYSTTAKTIDAKGMHLTNGIIDEHSHLAIYRGVNECSQAITAEVRIGDVIQPEDINIYRQLAGGVIGAQLLHGSCNPIGGQSALIKLRWGKSAEEMKIKGADGFIKFALGENVKQSGGGPGLRYPQTRMGVEQLYLDAFKRALAYEAELKKNPKACRKDLELEALLEILNKKRFISCHSYVQSEINMLMHIANNFGFKVNTFTHILEGYKVADKMKTHGVAASTFADWWAYKFEVMDAIPYNGAILNDMGIVTAINSDDAEMGRRLNQEAAKMIKYGNLSEEAAWKMVTLNPAKILHIDHLTGSIEIGKDADLVLWNNNPLSIYAKPLYTFVDGICYFSIETDAKLRTAVKQERNRIVQKMIALKQQGIKTQKQISIPDENYHCEDEN